MKAIIITGAGSGLGKELALMFSKQGYHTILCGRTEEKLANVKIEIEGAGGDASVLTLDIRNIEDVKEKMLILNKEFQLYGLVNNAGIGCFGRFAESSDQDADNLLSTNVLGTLHMTKAILPYLETNEAGLVLNIISKSGLEGKKNEVLFSTTEFAVRGFTESLQKEYEGTNIRLIPAFIPEMDTPFWEAHPELNHQPEPLADPKIVAREIFNQLDEDKTAIFIP